MPSVLIFTEMLASTGLGHFTRCTALYDAFTDQGADPLFVLHTDGTGGTLGQGYRIVQGNWKDPSVLREVFRDHPKAISVIDSYLANLAEYEFIRANSTKVVCVDDTKRLSYPENSIILNPGIRGEQLPYEIDKYQIFAGGRFALLSQAFQKETSARRPPTALRTMLITTGGEDRKNVSLLLIKAARNQFPDAEIILIIGPGFRNISEIENSVGSDITLIHQPNRTSMRSCMERADAAISAGGQSLYEFAVTGVPVIAFKAAENQTENIRGFKEAGASIDIGDPHDENFDMRVKAALRKIADPKIREAMSAAGMTSIDRQGAKNAVTMILLQYPGLKFRRARPEDAELYLAWANDTTVRDWSYERNPITPEQHYAWFREKVVDSRSLLLVFTDIDNIPVGQVRIDQNDTQTSAVIGISVDAGHRRKGYAAKMIAMASEFFFLNSRVKTIKANIHRANQASVGSFYKAGYKFLSEEVVKGIPSTVLLLEKKR